ncbi:MAG TPA: sigma-54 dependent transcriptional regulator [Ramlibacter sp.]|nr:sigma-54 dependent transcriptional regulator [Ramlibacter sp.]
MHGHLSAMIGLSAAFLRLKQRIERVAPYDVPVLIEGETGTGKDVAARAIHYHSARADHPFVPVNCGALPESLVENELFGHRRGAYTHAVTDTPGLLRLAEGGTLFLDEVDCLPAKGQAALLRLLEDPVYRPLGCGREVSFDVRVLAACNQDLEQLAAQGRFRGDLLFRLRLVALKLPPLRERDSDAELLAEHFVRGFARRYRVAERPLHVSAIAWIRHHQWPGNVRELQNWVCRGLLFGDADALRPLQEDLPLGDSRTGEGTGAGARAAACASDGASYRDARARALESFDRWYLGELMRRHGGNITHAAREAGKERRALARLLKRYELDAASFRDCRAH